MVTFGCTRLVFVRLVRRHVLNAIKRTRVNPRLKYSQKKTSRGELTKLKIRTNYKSGSAENWPDCALNNNNEIHKKGRITIKLHIAMRYS